MNNKNLIAILLATLWISISEFIRNEVLFKYYWIEHFDSLGITFPSEPINGMLWVVWSAILAVIIYSLLEEISFYKTVAIVWVMAFLMMWLVIGNLSVLPISLLFFAVPLSLLEVYIASFIINHFKEK